MLWLISLLVVLIMVAPCFYALYTAHKRGPAWVALGREIATVSKDPSPSPEQKRKTITALLREMKNPSLECRVLLGMMLEKRGLVEPEYAQKLIRQAL